MTATKVLQYPATQHSYKTLPFFSRAGLVKKSRFAFIAAWELSAR
jgi:hypothetical protein